VKCFRRDRFKILEARTVHTHAQNVHAVLAVNRMHKLLASQRVLVDGISPQRVERRTCSKSDCIVVLGISG
jgi:hypothetical protein